MALVDQSQVYGTNVSKYNLKAPKISKEVLINDLQAMERGELGLTESQQDQIIDRHSDAGLGIGQSRHPVDGMAFGRDMFPHGTSKGFIIFDQKYSHDSAIPISTS